MMKLRFLILALSLLCASANAAGQGGTAAFMQEPAVSLQEQEASVPESAVSVQGSEETVPLEEVRDTGIVVCLDPGHFAGKNAVEGDASYGYAEGDFTLELGLKLRDVLWEEYGIRAYMTRETGSISLHGYTDWGLDGSFLALRGAYAAECGASLFISLHTNANLDYANGYDTLMQPVSITKPIIIANSLVCDSEKYIGMCNMIGSELAAASYGLGISTVPDFEPAQAGNIMEWTDAYNDSLDTRGTVVRRTGNGGDYYAVLKGAADAGVPGIIIEHGFHTVPEMRREAMEGNLAEIWARADARGIARGLGIIE